VILLVLRLDFLKGLKCLLNQTSNHFLWLFLKHNVNNLIFLFNYKKMVLGVVICASALLALPLWSSVPLVVGIIVVKLLL